MMGTTTAAHSSRTPAAASRRVRGDVAPPACRSSLAAASRTATAASPPWAYSTRWCARDAPTDASQTPTAAQSRKTIHTVEAPSGHR